METEGPAEIQTDDCHPAKHGDAGKVTKVAKENTADVVSYMDVVDNEDVGGGKEDGGDGVPKIRKTPFSKTAVSPVRNQRPSAVKAEREAEGRFQ